MSAARVLALTGATGFIGGRLLQGLAAQGWSVRALTRRAPPPTSPGITWVRGDMDDIQALERLVEGARAVVHCAGRVRGRSAASFHHTNVEGTEKLVRVAAARRSGPRFLLLSSLAARWPTLSWYAASKYQAERRLVQHGDAMPWTILRPTAVYGPGDREMLGLFRAMRRGILPMPGVADARVTLLHVEDLAQAVLRWAGTERPPRGVYELHDGTRDGYGWDDLTAVAEAAWRRPVRRLPLPGPILAGVGWMNLGLAWMARYDPMLTPGKVRELRHPDWRCDNSAIQEALGWQPGITLTDSLQGDLLAVL